MSNEQRHRLTLESHVYGSTSYDGPGVSAPDPSVVRIDRRITVLDSLALQPSTIGLGGHFITRLSGIEDEELSVNFKDVVLIFPPSAEGFEVRIAKMATITGLSMGFAIRVGSTTDITVFAISNILDFYADNSNVDFNGRYDDGDYAVVDYVGIVNRNSTTQTVKLGRVSHELV